MEKSVKFTSILIPLLDHLEKLFQLCGCCAFWRKIYCLLLTEFSKAMYLQSQPIFYKKFTFVSFIVIFAASLQLVRVSALKL